MKTEKEIKERLEDLKTAGRLHNEGIISISSLES